MRRLVTVFGAFGLGLGLAAAVVLHHLPAVLVGQGSFFTWAAPGSLAAGTPVSISLQWTPSLLTLGGLGLAAGVIIALVLGLRGWRLQPADRPAP